MSAPSPGEPGSRGRGRGAQRKTTGDAAGQLSGGESAVRPREARFKGSGSCADGSPRPPGTAPPTRHRPASLPEGACTCTSVGAFLPDLPWPCLCPRACGAWTRSRAARGRPYPRSARSGSPPPPRLPTLGSGTRWNFPDLPLPPTPTSRALGRRVRVRRGAVRCGLHGVFPLAGVSGEEGGVLRSDCCTKPQRNKPGTEGLCGHLLCAPRLTQKQVNASALANYSLNITHAFQVKEPKGSLAHGSKKEHHRGFQVRRAPALMGARTRSHPLVRAHTERTQDSPPLLLPLE